MNRLLLTLLKFAISFGILGYLGYQTWQNDQFQILAATEKQYTWLLLAIVLGVATAVVSFYRWYLLVRALGLEFHLNDAIRLGFIGNFLNLLSIGVLGGDAVKAVFLARQMKGRAAEAVATVFIDRAIGLLTMFSMAGIGYLLVDISVPQAVHEGANVAFHTVCQISIALALVGFAGLGTLFFAPKFRRTSLFRWVSRWPAVGEIVSRLAMVVMVYRNKFQIVVVAFLLSILVNVMFASTFHLIAMSISDTHPTWPQHMVITPIAMVANAVPLPGGLGGLEFAVNYLYQGLSSQETRTEHGFLVAIGFRAMLLVTAGIGLIYYFASRREMDDLSRNAETTALP